MPAGLRRRCQRVARHLLLVLAPVLGGLYILFLPFLAILAVGVLTSQRLGRALGGGGRLRKIEQRLLRLSRGAEKESYREESRKEQA